MGRVSAECVCPPCLLPLSVNLRLQWFELLLCPITGWPALLILVSASHLRILTSTVTTRGSVTRRYTTLHMVPSINLH
jgi:hypothetical protein